MNRERAIPEIKPDLITVVGSSYFQPIATLTESLLKRGAAESEHATALHWENGFSCSIVVLLVATLESYTTRVRYFRQDEVVTAPKATPALLNSLFPGLPTADDLPEVFLLRNIVLHNHVWQLDLSDVSTGAPTLASPKELGFETNKNYSDIVNPQTRATVRLALHASPTSVNRTDVIKVFDTVWTTLKVMNTASLQHTPLGGRTVAFRGKFIQFEHLLDSITATI